MARPVRARILFGVGTANRLGGFAIKAHDALTVAARLKPDVLVSEMTLPGLRGSETGQRAAAGPHGTPDDREREVLLLTAEGLSFSEVAEWLDIGSRTAETHRAVPAARGCGPTRGGLCPS